MSFLASIKRVLGVEDPPQAAVDAGDMTISYPPRTDDDLLKLYKMLGRCHSGYNKDTRCQCTTEKEFIWRECKALINRNAAIKDTAVKSCGGATHADRFETFCAQNLSLWLFAVVPNNMLFTGCTEIDTEKIPLYRACCLNDYINDNVFGIERVRYLAERGHLKEDVRDVEHSLIAVWPADFDEDDLIYDSTNRQWRLRCKLQILSNAVGVGELVYNVMKCSLAYHDTEIFLSYGKKRWPIEFSRVRLTYDLLSTEISDDDDRNSEDSENRFDSPEPEEVGVNFGFF